MEERRHPSVQFQSLFALGFLPPSQRQKSRAFAAEGLLLVNDFIQLRNPGLVPVDESPEKGEPETAGSSRVGN